ncbi:MAG: Na/Pi cotransporter family protein [Sphaerochaetaceae bacterium]|nr:Na/Pi cotransporter family protein [Sphaerochaetaceae bacterium]
MDIFSIFTMVGGLALFLYGMETMGDGLVMLSGGKLEKILERLTDNRLKALLLGAFVTAVIQSSSATTVMVVGFVNSGIMNLTQSVGIIMGANIGTTITSWILSLTGISSTNFFLKLLKPSSFSPILAIVGVIFLMSSKSGSKKKIIGSIMIGFAVLMFGMETMSDAVKPLRNNKAFTNMLIAFSNPIIGVMAGALLTAVIQSSSASVGILQALCLSGAVNYSSAIPIIMGQNIGTCVTALISAIGARKNAKRAAFIHLYFNLIGTVLFMVVFYVVNSFVHFSFLDMSANAAGIAVIHTTFNISCSVVLFFFADKLVALSEWTVKDTEEKAEELPSELIALDERFLDNPSYAIKLCQQAVNRMAELSREGMVLTIENQDSYSKDKADRIIALEEKCDLFEDKVGTYLVKLAGKDLSTQDSHTLSILLHSISDIERISDHSINIAEIAKKMHEERLSFTGEGKSELDLLQVAVKDIINLTIKTFSNNDVKNAANIEPLEQVIDDLVLQIKQRHVERLRKGDCSMEAGLFLEDLVTNYERVSDHCSNIAVTMIEIQAGGMDMHEYLEDRVKGSDPLFIKEYSRLKSIYILP